MLYKGYMQMHLQNSFIYFPVQNHPIFRKMDALIFMKDCKMLTICQMCSSICITASHENGIILYN